MKFVVTNLIFYQYLVPFALCDEYDFKTIKQANG